MRSLLMLIVSGLLTVACTQRCPTGQTLCGGACVALASDADHCGTCGNACAGDQVCSQGACGCPAERPDACGAGAQLTCKNLQTDVDYCGSCVLACNGDDLCSSGTCVTTCEAGRTGCPLAAPTYCAVLASDRNNCGACGNACLGDQICEASACVCPSNVPNACGSGASAECVSFADDREHCGDCDTSCASDQDCNASSCVACIPQVGSQADPPGSYPAGLIQCFQASCPVIRCGTNTFWFFHYQDNRFSYALVGFDASGAIVVGPTEIAGDRYLQSLSVDTSGQNVLVSGQATTLSVAFSQFQVP